jgi:hypothetical protein
LDLIQQRVVCQQPQLLVTWGAVEEDADFKAQLEDRISRFMAQRDQLRRQLVEFNHALNGLEKRLEAAVDMYRLEFETYPPGLNEDTVPATPNRRGAGESWNDAIEAVLTEAGVPLHISDIWTRVQARGFTTTAKDPLRAIASVLVRHPQAFRTDPNTYALAGANGHAPMSAQQLLVPAADDDLPHPTPGDPHD